MQWREELTRRFPALSRLGEDCYVVGGAIRDLLIGREPADADVACLDPLKAARSIRERVIRLGDDENLTAYRVVDGAFVYDCAEILDHDIEVDLARRDFTINAMAVHLQRGVLLDFHGGARDLEARLVRMVRAANFDDDPLRLLKGARMAVTLGFEIEPETLLAIRQRATRIVDVAPERVIYELSVLLSAGKLREAITILEHTGLAGPLGLHPREVLEDAVSLAGAYALLVEDPRAHAARWRWSAELLADVLLLRTLVEGHDRIALFDAGERVVRQLPGLLRALGHDDHLDLPDFGLRSLLDGGEIAALTGTEPGPQLGVLKRALLEAQVRGQVTSRDEAVAFVKSA